MECFIIVTVFWIFSVCLHEFGHAWAAYCGGDHTVREKGYLTLNPIHYTHPVTSILLPALFMIMGGIGLPGGAVYIERHLLRSRGWDTWVSLAGPAMHLPIIFWISLVFKFGFVPVGPEHLSSISLALLLQLQISAVLLNLLPIPPLDGFQALAPWLRSDVREDLSAFSGYGMLLLFGLFWMVPPLNEAFWDIVTWISSWLGVPPYLADEGWTAFRFWKHGFS
jgi:Zn-dependent protease